STGTLPDEGALNEAIAEFKRAFSPSQPAGPRQAPAASSNGGPAEGGETGRAEGGDQAAPAGSGG
ncbi:MAG: hypothetical protein J2O39_06395, partial [Acidimicrobiales bacterium]|nr:hypothetical protein [Acidimicrobiales bacterium]